MNREDLLFEKYKLLISAMNHHYDNFNKWLTYFYVANAAVFFVYVQVVVNDIRSEGEFLVLLFGCFLGLMLYWSSKGYYYWRLNYIKLINHYENNLFKWNPSERIYSVFYDKNEDNKYESFVSAANFSTSKIAILFTYVVSNCWFIILIFTLISPYFDSRFTCVVISVVFSPILILLFSILKKDGNHYLASYINEMQELPK